MTAIMIHADSIWSVSDDGTRKCRTAAIGERFTVARRSCSARRFDNPTRKWRGCSELVDVNGDRWFIRRLSNSATMSDSV